MKQHFRIRSFYAKKKIAQMQVSLNTFVQRVEKKLPSTHLSHETPYVMKTNGMVLFTCEQESPLETNQFNSWFQRL